MSNRERIFDSVLSVEAWHTSFSEEDGLAFVHVDVSFLKGKMGDEPDSPVRFEIGLKRAEVRFVIPTNEPLRVIQSTVKREKPVAVTTAIRSEDASDLYVGGGAGFNLSNMAANVNASASGSKQVAHKTSRESLSQSGSATWAQSKTHYRWEFAPTLAKVLLGKAWDAVTEPLLQVRRTNAGALTPVCRIEVHCRREDLDATHIKIKDDSTIKRLASGRIFENKMAAIEAYIRTALAARNLDIRNFEDPYGQILLADVVVDELVK